MLSFAQVNLHEESQVQPHSTIRYRHGMGPMTRKDLKWRIYPENLEEGCKLIYWIEPPLILLSIITIRTSYDSYGFFLDWM